MRIHSTVRAAFLVAVFAAPALAAAPAEWTEPHLPFKIYGNTYYVGTQGLAAVLITWDRGHILIDAGLPESAALIADNINALGFHPEDVKVILNSHAHFDHAGGISELQRLTGARVMASFPSMAAMVTGAAAPDDPQFTLGDRYPQVPQVTPLSDGQQVAVGPLRLTAHFTPGHTPGSTTWTWESCEGAACRHMVYADSLTAVSAPGFKFSAQTARVLGFKHAIATVAQLPCDILLTPHPEASALWQREARKDFTDKGACRRYAEAAGKALDQRLAGEAK